MLVSISLQEFLSLESLKVLQRKPRPIVRESSTRLHTGHWIIDLVREEIDRNFKYLFPITLYRNCLIQQFKKSRTSRRIIINNPKKKFYKNCTSYFSNKRKKTNTSIPSRIKTSNRYNFLYSSHSNERTKENQKKKKKEYHKTREIKIEIVEVVDRTQQPWTRRPEWGRRR